MTSSTQQRPVAAGPTGDSAAPMPPPSGRLPAVAGEWVDRTRPLAFTFEGRPCSGFEGDTPSSALWAAGVRILGRSFKYHRPRGVLSMANHDVNTLMQAGPRLNLRADV